MNSAQLRLLQPAGIVAGLMITAALGLWPAASAGAQATATCNGVPATIIGVLPGQITGTAGNDVIVGTTGADQIFGLGGADIICAGPGNDQVDGGDNDDTLVWNPGDGSDVVEGQAGSDTLQFNGSNANENIDLSANGARLRFFRDVAAVTMDVNDTEQVTFGALGGADTITVNSLAGTDTTTVTLDLASALNGVAGDSQADSVIVNGTPGTDNITITGGAGSLAVTGLPASVNIRGAEGALDSLQVNVLEGNDTITTRAPEPAQASGFKLFLSLVGVAGSGTSNAVADAVDRRQVDARENTAAGTAEALPAGVIKLTLNGGTGDDTLNGSAGNDQVTGGPGTDTAALDAGDDTFTWNPGDGSDVVEGQAGSDTLQFNGSNANENINLAANGARLLFSRDVAAVVMDLDDTERINFAALGGTDTITVNNLAGTDAQQVNLNLASTLNGTTGDGVADTVIVNGTAGNDNVTIGGSAGSLAVAGLSASVNVSVAESTDKLTVNGLGGLDAVNAQSLVAGVVSLFLDGGAGNDTLIGSAGNDTLTGGLGADFFSGGPGIDIATDFNVVQGDTQDGTIP